jgi:hypothetical protein
MGVEDPWRQQLRQEMDHEEDDFQLTNLNHVPNVGTLTEQTNLVKQTNRADAPESREVSPMTSVITLIFGMGAPGHPHCHPNLFDVAADLVEHPTDLYLSPQGLQQLDL